MRAVRAGFERRARAARWDPDAMSGVSPITSPTGQAPFTYNLLYPGQYLLNESGLYYNYFRTYDPRVGSYIEPDPIGQLFYFNISNIPGVSQRHRGYWNKLYAYADGNALTLKDPTGLGGLFDWLWDLFKEKSPEQIETNGIAKGLGSQCLVQNCGKSRAPIDILGDCQSYFDEFMTKMGAKVSGAALNIINVDAGAGVISECAEFCEKGIKSGTCCKQGK
jgi:RHS repeat-associated protein